MTATSRVEDRYHRLSERLAQFKHACQQAPAQAPATPALAGGMSVDKSDKQFCAEVEAQGLHSPWRHLPGGAVPLLLLPCPSPIAAYRRLKQTNPSPYMFYVQDEGFTLFGASPESAVKFCATSRDVEMYPIAGTRRRGFNPDGSINRDPTAASSWNCVRTRKRWPST